ncbi:MAG: patatin-like phospholipase family protein [Proteobacteria bacterium]|jgi:NTE family protein|nr:patatin [Methylibium sp.]MBY0365242.1 patatin-like phospholipase family protein [Burkholderiaceae bacterium]MCH8855658.1 patatin-like phospholipase family protein [Pseudomonadota bacterium]|mmetsp:Transcript_10637/g.43591  ORF Transcript_10637/g.43591 Transcript_10637/m.43591 type:complete len:368 (-) Transcript_10637:1157-2260(-)
MASRRPPQTVYVFQGGGALGAYQAGVAEALDAGGIAPDWLVGTSIGAINATLIAGNKPADRIAALREFWSRVTRPGLPMAGPTNAFAAGLQTWQTLVGGVPGFFRPRGPLAWDLNRPAPLTELGFYDTSPLAATLDELVNYALIDAADTRLTLCAVNVRTGELARFDNRDEQTRIRASHVLASGALPPGFAPVQIGREAYWDGGIYSNTPLDVVLDDSERRDTLCFMVDLWDASEAAPRTMAQALTRYKDIQYASRICEHLDDHARMQNLRRALRQVGRRLGPAAAADPAVKALLALGCDSRIDVEHLVMQAQPGEDSWRDIDFTAARLQARWDAGLHDGRRVVRRAAWREPPHDDVGMRVHTLPEQ